MACEDGGCAVSLLSPILAQSFLYQSKVDTTVLFGKRKENSLCLHQRRIEPLCSSNLLHRKVSKGIYHTYTRFAPTATSPQDREQTIQHLQHFFLSVKANRFLLQLSSAQFANSNTPLFRRCPSTVCSEGFSSLPCCTHSCHSLTHSYSHLFSILYVIISSDPREQSFFCSYRF